MPKSEDVPDDRANIDTDVTDLTSQLLAMVAGLGQTQVISLAAKLGIADRLKDGARTAEQLGQAMGGAPFMTVGPIEDDIAPEDLD